MEITKDNIKTVTAAPEYIKKTLTFNDSVVLQINIKYPDIKILPSVLYDKTEKKINGFYDASVKNFINFCEKKLYKSAAAEYWAYKNTKNAERTEEKDETEETEIKENDYIFKPFGAVVTFEVAYNKEDFLCIYLDMNIYAGKGRGNSVRKAHIWKISSGELLAPARFIKFTRQFKSKICRYIYETMENQVKKGEEYFIRTDMPSIYRYLNMKNFYLSENGYSFFFPQNTLVPAENGIVSFEIPEKAISAFLSSNK